MAKVITPGKKPDPPWYDGAALKCPACGCIFALERKDLREKGGPYKGPGRYDSGALWQPSQDGTVIEGPCPDCDKLVTIGPGDVVSVAEPAASGMVPETKAAATDRQTETRATLPYGITGWRWMFDKAPRKVAAFPLRGNRLIEVELSGPDRYHAVIRQDGQIRADMTVHRDQIGTRWLSIEEPDAAQLDMELVDFVRALGIGRPHFGVY